MPLSQIPIGGLRSLEADELIPFESAVRCDDCLTDDDSVYGRNGYRSALAGAVVGAGNPQGIWRDRNSPSSAKAILGISGTLYTVTDPTSENASDGVAAAIAGGPHFGPNANLSAAQLGRYLYVATDEAGVAWRRVKSDFTLETLGTLFKGVKPTSALSALAIQKYNVGNALPAGWAKADGGGATSHDFVTTHDWWWVDNGAGGAAPIGGTLTLTMNADQDWRTYNWVAVMMTPPTQSAGSPAPRLEVSVATLAGGFESIGSVADLAPRQPGSPNVLYCPLIGLSSATRQVVRRIRFTLQGSTNNGLWAVYGHMMISTAPGVGSLKYQVTFFNSGTQQRSEPTEELTVDIKQGDILVPSFHSIYSDGAGLLDEGVSRSLDPNVLPRARNGNVDNGLAEPDRNEFASVPTISGVIPNADLFPASDTVELWRLTETGYRLAKTLTLASALTTTYALVDDQGDLVLGNSKYKAQGSPPRATAIAARGGRLVSVYENRASISSYLSPGANSDPYPQFPAIALETADGWAFDFASGTGEQGQAVVNGDAMYILTNEACYAIADLSAPIDGSIPPFYRVFERGVLGRRGACWKENRLFWASWDGVYMTRNRVDTAEMTQEDRRLYTDWLAPDSTVVVDYQDRKLYVTCGLKQLRYDFVRGRWSRHNLNHTFLHSASWKDPGSSYSQLWYLTSDRKIARWQKTATRDMEVGVDATTGLAIPDWEYSTGFTVPGQSIHATRFYADVAGGAISVFVHSTMESEPSRRSEFAVGEAERPFPQDMSGKKARIRITGENPAKMRRLMWDLEVVDKVGAA